MTRIAKITDVVDDDRPIGRILTRREVLTLGGARGLVACAPAALSAATPAAQSTAAARPGTPFVLTFNLSRLSSGGRVALQGTQVDIWHCDAPGVYFFDDAFNAQVFATAPCSQKGAGWLRNAGDGIYTGGGDKLLLKPAASANGFAANFDLGIA